MLLRQPNCVMICCKAKCTWSDCHQSHRRTCKHVLMTPFSCASALLGCPWHHEGKVTCAGRSSHCSHRCPNVQTTSMTRQSRTGTPIPWDALHCLLGRKVQQAFKSPEPASAGYTSAPNCLNSCTVSSGCDSFHPTAAQVVSAPSLRDHVS